PVPRAGAGELARRHVDPLGPGERSARLRLFQPQRARAQGHRLRLVSRPRRPHEPALSSRVPADGVVPRLPSPSREAGAPAPARVRQGLATSARPAHAGARADQGLRYPPARRLRHLPSLGGPWNPSDPRPPWTSARSAAGSARNAAASYGAASTSSPAAARSSDSP